jgi:hypothetical protein
VTEERDEHAVISIREAERLTGITHKTLKRWREKGLLVGDLTLASIRAAQAQTTPKLANELSLAEAATMLGVSRAQVHAWQQGHAPRLPRPLTRAAVEQLRSDRAAVGKGPVEDVPPS